MEIPAKLDPKAVVIDERKLLHYALNPEHPDGKHKARTFFDVLGYDRSNYSLLLDNIKARLSEYPVIEGFEDQYGKRFSVTLKILGLRGREAYVRTAWIRDADDGVIRLTSVFVIDVNDRGVGR